jgi:transcriptional regulator with XRE-family HTH domain
MKSNITKSQLAEYLKQCRELAGYNQKQMAAHLGVNYVSYNKYEYGASLPRYKTLAQIMEKASEICEPPPFDEPEGAPREGAATQEGPDPLLERKPGDALLKRPDPLNEDRTFEEQMNDLGVLVVRPEKPQEAPQEATPQIVWHRGQLLRQGHGRDRRQAQRFPDVCSRRQAADGANRPGRAAGVWRHGEIRPENDRNEEEQVRREALPAEGNRVRAHHVESADQVDDRGRHRPGPVPGVRGEGRLGCRAGSGQGMSYSDQGVLSQ